MSIIKFSFSAIGKTRAEVIDELDNFVAATMANLSGEPWIDVTDAVEKIAISQQVGDPSAWIYQGRRESVFAGPTPLDGDGPIWRDGFRPQHNTE